MFISCKKLPGVDFLDAGLHHYMKTVLEPAICLSSVSFAGLSLLERKRYTVKFPADVPRGSLW